MVSEQILILCSILLNFVFFYWLLRTKIRTDQRRTHVFLSSITTVLYWGSIFLMLKTFLKLDFAEMVGLKWVPLFFLTFLLFFGGFSRLTRIEHSMKSVHFFLFSIGLGIGFVAIESVYFIAVLSYTSISGFVLGVGIVHTTTSMFLTQRVIQQIRIDQYINRKKVANSLLFFVSLMIGLVMFGAVLTVGEAFFISGNSYFFIIEFLSLLLLIFITIGYGEKQYTEKQQEIISKNIELSYLAHHDPLTSMYNRLFIQNKMEELIEGDERFSLLNIDLDHFKQINDFYGHQFGDHVLKIIADRLNLSLNDGDMAARLGGDEFIVIFKEMDYKETIQEFAQKLISLFCEPIYIDHCVLGVTSSIGIASYPEDGSNLDDLQKKSDMAMYNAKGKGRNRFSIFDKQMEKDRLSELQLKEDLSRALKRKEFLLHYQPQIDLKSNKIIGFEALIRWNRPKMGMVLPDQFIKIAEDTGLILPIGQWVLEEACSQVENLNKTYGESFRISVNLSLKQFTKKNLLESVSRALQISGLPANRLGLEITESTAMEDTLYTMEVLKQLNLMGVHISIDDFGTGYSSLNYLKEFDIQSIKIDKSFIKDLASNRDDISIVNAILSLAKNLGLKVVAEGVEAGDQEKHLIQQGCDEAQGFFYSMPLNDTQISNYIDRMLIKR